MGGECSGGAGVGCHLRHLVSTQHSLPYHLLPPASPSQRLQQVRHLITPIFTPSLSQSGEGKVHSSEVVMQVGFYSLLGSYCE